VTPKGRLLVPARAYQRAQVVEDGMLILVSATFLIAAEYWFLTQAYDLM
jgi:hypothetical protein